MTTLERTANRLAWTLLASGYAHGWCSVLVTDAKVSEWLMTASTASYSVGGLCAVAVCLAYMAKTMDAKS